MAGPHRGIFERSEVADSVLEARCSEALSRLRATSDADVTAALADPREIHRALYADLAPEDCPEAAGNYRGSDHPRLKNAVVFYAFNETEGTTTIASPHEVQGLMDRYGGLIRAHVSRGAPTIDEKLERVAALMVFFGLIHPFRDGNGHIQRITAQCLIERSGLKMAPAWRAHPCPYGEDFHRALAARDVGAVAARLRGFVE